MIESKDLKPYEGREHAKAKHSLFESYVTRYVMILGVSKAPSLAFVDGFAGPWKQGTTDYSDTSFGLFATTLKKCAEALRARFGQQPSIRALWIEEDPVAFEQLEKVAKSASNSRVQFKAEQGRFQDQIPRIVDFLGKDTYGFVFIDPTGYKGLIEASTLAPLLNLPKIELLINFMWDHIRYNFGLMHKPGVVRNARALLGQQADNVSTIEDAEEREVQTLRAYETELRSSCGSLGRDKLRVLSYPIRDTRGQQLSKYYLVHATHSPKGLVTFAEACEKADEAQATIYRLAQMSRREKKTAVSDLFPDRPTLEGPIGEPATEPWLELLQHAGDERTIDTECWADLLEAGRCLPTALLAGAKTLLKDGVILNTSATKPRRTRFVDYSKKDIVQRLK